jgi:hypothetical protein
MILKASQIRRTGRSGCRRSEDRQTLIIFGVEVESRMMTTPPLGIIGNG